MADPQCLRGSLSQPGCAANRLQAEIDELRVERVLVARNIHSSPELLAKESVFIGRALIEIDRLRAALATARKDERERCIKAIDDAGGDNTVYHIEAIRNMADEG